MADVNAPSGQAPAMAPPVCTDDQILPCIRCQLDEQWFVLTKDTLREALQTTPFNNNQAFVAPPSSDAERPLEFTQSIHTFIEDKWNLSRHTTGKKKATLIVISSIRFTKLIIHHLQRRHKFHPRPDTLLHLPNEKPVLGYLKFSANGTKREEYLANVAKHRRYLASETGSDQDSPTPKPTKLARKPKSTAPKAPLRPSVSTPVTSAQPTPTLAPAKPKEKKLKQATETSDKPPKAKKSKYGFISKKQSLKPVAASVAEDVPAMEPHVAAEDADLQKALGESMKTMYAPPRDLLPPVVIREPESGEYQPLPEVPGKGKEKVTEEQSKSEETEKVVPGADEGGQGESEGRAGLDHGAQAEGQTGSDAGTQDEGQAGSNPDEISKGQDGPDPGNAGADVQSIPSPVVHAGLDRKHMDLDVTDVSPQPSTEQLDEGFTVTAYPKVQENLKLTVEEQVLLEDPASSSGTLSSLQHLSKVISFGDLFFSDKPSEADNDKTTAETEVESMVPVTIQQDTSSIPPMTSPIIDLTSRPESPKVHQQFKATTTKTTTTTTTITLPPSPAQQQSTVDAMVMKRIGELKYIMANLIQVNKDMKERLDKHMACLYTLEQLDIPQQVSKAIKILHQRMWESESDKSHEDHMQLFEALEKSMNCDHSEELTQDMAEASKKNKKSRESPKMPPVSPPHQPPPHPPPTGSSRASGAPGASGSSQVLSPPPPPSTYQESQSKGSATPSSSKTSASAKYQAWTTTEIRLRPSISMTPADLEMDADIGPDEQAQSSDDEDIKSAHIPKVNLRQDWLKPLEEERPATPEPAWSIPSSDVPIPIHNWASALASNYSPPLEDSLLAQTGDIATFMDWFCKRRGITELKPQDLEGPAFEIVKVFHPAVIHLQYQMEECHKLLTNSVDDPILRHNVNKPLPLGGPPSQVTIQSDFFFNKDLEYLRYGSKVFSIYGYDYMKKIVLRHADLKEHVIAERDFKYIYPSDFEDLYLLNLQGHLNHLPPKDKKILTMAVNQWTRHLVIRQRVEDFQLGIESYQTQLNLTKPQWDSMSFEYKHDYTVIDSPRAVVFKYEVLDQEGRGSEQGVHVRHSKAIEDKKDLPQPGELCWWMRQRGRLQTSEAYPMIKSFQHSRPLSDDLIEGIHSTFHVSNLKKCLAKGDVVIPLDEIQLDDKLHMIKEPMEVVDSEVTKDEDNDGVEVSYVLGLQVEITECIGKVPSNYHGSLCSLRMRVLTTECFDKTPYYPGFFEEESYPVYDTNNEEDAKPAPKYDSDGDELMYEWRWNNIFRTKCTSKGKVCNIIIDEGSCENVVSTYMVEKLALKTEKYQEGYLKAAPIDHKLRFTTIKDSLAEHVETKSNVWDDGSDDVNHFGGRNPRYRDRGYHPHRNDHAIDHDDRYRDDLIRSMGLKIEIPKFIEEVINKFDNLHMRCDVVKEEEQVVAWFLGVLKPEIADIVCLQPYWTYTDVCHLAFKVKNQIKVKSKGTTSHFTTTRTAPPTTPKSTTLTTSVAGNTTLHVNNAPRCYKCSGLGHYARDCWNRKTLAFVPDDANPIYDTDAEPKLDEPCNKLNQVYFQGEICDMIIDGGGCENVVSTYMVKKLGMKTEYHPEPYQITWLKKGNAVKSIFSLCYLFRNSLSSTTMGDENPIHTLRDYSKPSHEGYINTIELPVGNNVDGYQYGNLLREALHPSWRPFDKTRVKDYDEEREMEPSPEDRREATLILRLRSFAVCRQQERVVRFEDGQAGKETGREGMPKVLGLRRLKSKKSSWDNKRGQKKYRFSPYRGPNHGLLTGLSKRLKEILATEKAARSFEPPLKMFGRGVLANHLRRESKYMLFVLRKYESDCVPRSLFWREDPNRDRECGFDYLTSTLLSLKAHREGCRPSRSGFPYWYVCENALAIQRCELSHKELDAFLSSYFIPLEYRVILPTPTQTILDAPPRFRRSSKGDTSVVHAGSVAARIRESKCKTRGGLEDCLELKDATACHLKISTITPPTWKGFLDNHLVVDLLNFHDCCYARQAVVDNAMNRRSCELLEVIEKLKGEANVMRSRKLAREEEYKGLRAKCEAAMTDFDKNLAILLLREKMSLLATEEKEHKGNLDRLMIESQKWSGYQVSLLALELKVASLEAKKANLEATEALLHQEIEESNHDRRELVSKVVRYSFIKLLYSDELGRLVGKLVSSAITFDRCRAYEQVARMKEPFDLSKVKGYHPLYEKEHTQASNDLATATFSWLNEGVADASAFVEALLSKKPPTLQKPISLRT
uniref:Reverse transcriptase domain-containing protein n=1 Tax=Tanacetum cinerariifolium TaxID=118510 RepID=A0A6L2K465_TANCI|nr:reverse transcriptase domain-containing protein [Tanacetum cinerariifolium]